MTSARRSSTTTVTVAQTIEAPVHVVFNAIANFESLPSITPEVVRVEILSECRSGIGTRFRETRRMRGKEIQTELEVTAFDENAELRLVADSHGTVWDTLYTLRPAGDGTELRLSMEARAQQLLPRLVHRLMKVLYRRGMTKYLEDLGRHCEAWSDAQSR